MFRVYYYGQHKWENYLLDIDESVRSSGEKTQKLGHETRGLRETVRGGFESLRSSLEDLHNGIEDMRADFEWGFSLLADRMDAQISIMAGIAKKLDSINSTLGAPLDTQARELYRIGVARLRDGLDDKALEAFLKSEQKNDVDFALQLYIGKLYLYGKDVINLRKATEHLLLAARYAEAKRGSLVNWNRYAAEAYFHAAVAVYIEGENALGDGNHQGETALLQKALGFLSKASSLRPEFLEVTYFRAKCCSLLGKSAEVLECFETLADRDRRYFLKAAEDKDFNNEKNRIREVADHAIANPGPLAQKIMEKSRTADEALSWAKHGNAKSSGGANKADAIAERIANAKRILTTLEADLVGLDRQLDDEIADALKLAEVSLNSHLQTAQAALKAAQSSEIENAETKSYLQGQLRIKTEQLKSQSGVGMGCGFAALTYFVGGPVVMGVGFMFLKVTTITPQSAPLVIKLVLYSFLLAVIVGIIAARVRKSRKQLPFRREIAELQDRIRQCDQEERTLAQRASDASKAVSAATKDVAELQPLRDKIRSTGVFGDIPSRSLRGDYSVTLSTPGPNKINTIKLIQELTGLDLPTAKALVDGTPSVVFRDDDLSKVTEISSRFTAIGAVASVIQELNDGLI